MSTAIDPQADLARTALVEGRFHEAVDLAHSARSGRADDPLLAWIEGRALLELDRQVEAESTLAAAARLAPGSGEVLSCWGAALAALGRSQDALQVFMRALELAPQSEEVLIRVGQYLLDRGESGSARTLFQTAAKSGSLDGLAGLVDLCARDGHLAEGLALISGLPDGFLPSPLLVLAVARLMRARGEAGKACNLLENLLALRMAPRLGARALHLLGELREELGEYDAAFDAHTRAHAQSHIVYNPSSQESRVQAICSRFTRERFARQPRCETPVAGSLLIAGMPRSGTNLVARLLSLHSAVRTQAAGVNLLQTQERLNFESAEELNKVASRYRDSVERARQGAQYACDAQACNYLALGTAALIAPGTKVIHCKRQALDNCLSIYFHDFQASHDFATNLRALGHSWKLYERLSDHWSAHLSLAVHEVHYEQLVAQPKAELTRLLAFLGLSWESSLDGACQPAVARSAGTAIHTLSLGRAQHFTAQLAPLRKELGL